MPTLCLLYIGDIRDSHFHQGEWIIDFSYNGNLQFLGKPYRNAPLEGTWRFSNCNHHSAHQDEDKHSEMHVVCKCSSTTGDRHLDTCDYLHVGVARFSHSALPWKNASKCVTYILQWRDSMCTPRRWDSNVHGMCILHAYYGGSRLRCFCMQIVCNSEASRV